MSHPETIYLTEPIKLHGIEIRHTLYGLNYLVDHYETILRIATAKQLSNEARAHIEQKLLPNYKIHIELYERQTTTP